MVSQPYVLDQASDAALPGVADSDSPARHHPHLSGAMGVKLGLSPVWEWGCSCRLQVREWRRWGSEPGTWTRGPIISISHDSVNGLSFRDGLDRCCFVIPCACTGTYAMPTTTYGHPFAALLAFHPPPPWQQGGKWQTPRRAFVEDKV